MSAHPTSQAQRQFALRRIFILLALLAIVFALIGLWTRPVPGKVPESAMRQQVASVQKGMPLDELTRTFGFEPDADWLDETKSGYVCWRFVVSDVPYADSRASYFAKLEQGVLRSGFLLYPIEAAGGGMRF